MGEYGASKVYLFSVPRGEEVVSYVEKFAESNGVSAAIVQAIGYLENPVIGYYDMQRDAYSEIELRGFYELVSGIGNISLRGGKPSLHLHASLGDSSGKLYGGHLVSSRVVVAEVAIISLEGPPLVRERVSRSLWLWKQS